MTSTAIKPCPHHWDIDTPSGKPTVHGACKLCGEERDFPSSQDGVQPEDVPPAPGKPRPHQRIYLKGSLRGPKPAQQALAGMIGKQEGTCDPKKEETVPKGGSTHARSVELRPAKKAAEELFSKGNSVTKVLAILRPTFGEISTSTVNGWKIRASAKNVEGLQTPRLLDAVMAARPPFAERDRCRRWKLMFDAAFELLIEEG